MSRYATICASTDARDHTCPWAFLASTFAPSKNWDGSIQEGARKPFLRSPQSYRSCTEQSRSGNTVFGQPVSNTVFA
jgi:hypothetical protein